VSLLPPQYIRSIQPNIKNPTRALDQLWRRGVRLKLPDDLPDLAWATPLAWATRRRHQHIVELLKHYEQTD
jgi:hypothetical protein